MTKRLMILASLLALAGCWLPPPDQPAHYTRMGRFMGLVALCGCSSVTPERMVADYPKALGGRYSDAEIKAMRAYVDLASIEKWPNQAVICAEVCSQRCMVQAVVEPLGAAATGTPPCLVSERDLHLTQPDGPTDSGPVTR
jgi:hypothetical protein